MTHSGHCQLSYRLAAAAVLCACLLMAASSAAAAAPSAWQMTPYRVQVLVAVSPEARLAPRVQSQLRADLAARIDAVVGAAWEATVAPAPPALGRALAANIDALGPDAVAAAALKGDKAMLVAITPAGGGLRVAARDFDVFTQTFSPSAVRTVWQVGMLRDAVADALFAAFAPLARVERAQKDQVLLRPKAAALPTRDPNLSLLHVGDVFRPIMRSSDRDGKFRRAAPVPWTFCTVEKLTADEARCRVTSGMRGALALRGRGRVESLALRIVPPHGSTTLLLQSRTAPKVPLAGYDVYARLTGEKSSTLLGRTNRQGRLVVPPAEGLVRVLLVRNGGELLARLPVVPGLEPQVTAEIANDDRRLEAEGFITGLQEELVDLVARREVLMSRIRARIEAKQLDKAGELLDELRRMPAAQQFVFRLTNAQQRLATSDAVVQHKVDALLADTRKLIDKHLDPRGIEDLEKQLRSAEEAGKAKSR
jgi:hypothetical protein